MTRDPGDGMYRGGRFARAVASLVGLSPARSQSPVRQPGSNSDWVRTAQDANGDLLDGLTAKGRDVLEAARNEAWILGQNKVGTEHLLLALTRGPESDACRVMEQFRTSPLRVRTDVLDSLSSGAATPSTAGAKPIPGPLGLTPRARLAVQLGHRASARMGVPATEPEHLLIGLAAEGEGVAARALRKSGMTARSVEKRVATGLDARKGP